MCTGLASSRGSQMAATIRVLSVELKGSMQRVDGLGVRMKETGALLLRVFILQSK